MDSSGSVESVLHDPCTVSSVEEVSENEDVPQRTTWYDSILARASKIRESDVSDSLIQALWQPRYGICGSREPTYDVSFRGQDDHRRCYLSAEPFCRHYLYPYHPIQRAQNPDHNPANNRTSIAHWSFLCYFKIRLNLF